MVIDKEKTIKVMYLITIEEREKGIFGSKQKGGRMLTHTF